MRKLFNWGVAVGHWLLVPWLLWFGIGLIAAAMAISLRFAPLAEDGLRYAGVFLELAGILTVVIGILDKRAAFNRPGFWVLLKQWVAQFPSFRSRSANVSGSAAITASGSIVSGHLTTRPGPGASLESRVIALESQLLSLQEHTNTIQQEAQERDQRLNARVDEESERRASEIQKLFKKFEEFGADNLHLETVGILWLVVGLITSNLPREIMSFLASFG